MKKSTKCRSIHYIHHTWILWEGVCVYMLVFALEFIVSEMCSIKSVFFDGFRMVMNQWHNDSATLPKFQI